MKDAQLFINILNFFKKPLLSFRKMAVVFTTNTLIQLIHMSQVLSASVQKGFTFLGSVEQPICPCRDIGLTTYITKIKPVLEYASPV